MPRQRIPRSGGENESQEGMGGEYSIRDRTGTVVNVGLETCNCVYIIYKYIIFGILRLTLIVK